MVEPVSITISIDQVGLNKIDLPQFAGYKIMVSRRGMDYLTDDEVRTLETGGFELKIAGDKFILKEVFTVVPLPQQLAAPFSNPVYPVSQYPHRMVLTTVTSSTRDGNGNYVPGGTSSREMYCRAEPNSKNAYITLADGTALYYDYNVYMPLPVDTVSVGTKAEVFSNNEIMSSASVKRFSRGQLNARLWL